MKLNKRISNVLTTGIMLIISIIFLLPLVWMLSASAKFESDVMTFPIQWIPERWNWLNNFKDVWFGDVPFYLFYLNSIKLAGLMTASTLLISSLAAFSFSKLKYPGRNLLFVSLISVMIIPEQATLVPRYILIRWLGLYNTHEGIILMGMFAVYFTFLLRQFMQSVHNEFIEAAKIDGCGYLRIFWQIMIPLSKPILATVGIIKFIWSWNNYQDPLIFLFDKKLYPITVGLDFFKTQFEQNYALTMSASVSAILPLLIVFIILQKQVIKGISLGGVKG